MSGAVAGSWLFLLWRLFRLAALEGTAKETWALNFFLRVHRVYPLKMDGWETSFLLGWPTFRGYLSFREGYYV